MSEMKRLYEQLQKMNDQFGEGAMMGGFDWNTMMGGQKVTKEGNTTVLTLDLPGKGPEDVDVSMQGRQLVVTISGHPMHFSLNTVPDTVTAKMEKGRLEVRLTCDEVKKPNVVKVEVRGG
jgi:HSP20 family molecular chaperone IbpA